MTQDGSQGGKPGYIACCRFIVDQMSARGYTPYAARITELCDYAEKLQKYEAQIERLSECLKYWAGPESVMDSAIYKLENYARLQRIANRTEPVEVMALLGEDKTIAGCAARLPVNIESVKYNSLLCSLIKQMVRYIDPTSSSDARKLLEAVEQAGVK